MPIFISYSHSDRDFVDQLASQLVAHKVNVWLDRWELHIGDSLIERIQQAITDASALLVILSPESIQSEWCKKELNSALVRELEERRIIVLPILVRDCKIPLFLREKLYADFRTNFDDGLKTILESIAKVTNMCRNRLEEPAWHTDWAIESGETNKGISIIRLTLVEITESQPYSVLTVISIIPALEVNIWFKEKAKQGDIDSAYYQVIEGLSNELTRLNIRILLEDQYEKTESIPFSIGRGDLIANISVRWLGTDTGRDVLFNTAQQIDGIKTQMKLASLKPKNT